jgi:predicted PurR-regulated permease PerM
MYHAVKGYVNGQVLLAAMAAVIVLPAMLVFHVSYPIALMAVIFICALIPVIGHTIAIIIVTVVALFHSPFSALGIFVYYILYQQIEAYLIIPRLQANNTKLTPLFVFLALVIGVSFGGLLGGLVAIPVMACLRVVVLDYLNTKHLLDESTDSSVVQSK